jgi:membrane-associated PAP2 superfamily phosphatase
MPHANTPTYVALRDLSPARRLGRFTWLTLLCLLAWDFSGLDSQVMHLIGNASGFALKDNWWMEEILHTRARHLSTLVFVGVLAMVWWPRGPFRSLNRLQRTEIVAGIALSLIAVSSLKRISLTSCPWDLQAFGGAAQYVSHWQWGLSDGGDGHCFPGGHASSALAFLALCLPWLASAQDAQRQTGRRILVGVLLLGAVLGLTQTLRGAHYPSHTFWTGFICWAVALLNHGAFAALAHYRARQRA